MYGLRLPDRDTGLITQSKDFKHLLEPHFVGVFAMSAGTRTVSNLTPFLGMGEVIIDFLLQFLSCSKRTNFLLRLSSILTICFLTTLLPFRPESVTALACIEDSARRKSDSPVLSPTRTSNTTMLSNLLRSAEHRMVL